MLQLCIFPNTHWQKYEIFTVSLLILLKQQKPETTRTTITHDTFPNEVLHIMK